MAPRELGEGCAGGERLCDLTACPVGLGAEVGNRHRPPILIRRADDAEGPADGASGAEVRTAPIPQVMGAAVEEWVRTGEVARSLGVSRWTVRRLILSGVLPARRFAERGTFLVDRVDLEMFLERSRVHAEAA